MLSAKMGDETMESISHPLVGTTLGTCMLRQPLGAGGMGAVYLARQTRPIRDVAVKVLQPSMATQQEFLVRFRREADVIARLDHVNIMPIYEYGEQDGLAYLVMPYLTGGSLRDTLIQRDLANTLQAIADNGLAARMISRVCVRSGFPNAKA